MRSPTPAQHRTRGEEHGGTGKARLGQGRQDPRRVYTRWSGLPGSMFGDPQLCGEDGLEWGDNNGLGKSGMYTAKW